MQLRDTTENFPDDDEIFGCWIHTIDFALDFHWKSTFSEKNQSRKFLKIRFFKIDIDHPRDVPTTLGCSETCLPRFPRSFFSPFILHHKLACFIDGNTGIVAWAWGSISFFFVSQVSELLSFFVSRSRIPVRCES